MTLKIYDTQDAIPEGLRSEYKQSGNKWVPDLSEDHPVLVLNKSLIQEKGVEEAKVKKLTRDLDDALAAAKTGDVPRGQALVAKADVDLLNGVKALGKTLDELKTITTEHSTLKESETRRTREDKQRLVAKELGFDNADAFVLLSDLPDFDIREKDGKKSVIALVKDGDKLVEKPAMEFLEGSPRHAPLLPALKTQNGGVTVHGTSTATTNSGDPFAWAKRFAEDYSKQSQPAGDLVSAFYNTGGKSA